jgi:hypothetical protein
VPAASQNVGYLTSQVEDVAAKLEDAAGDVRRGTDRLAKCCVDRCVGEGRRAGGRVGGRAADVGLVRGGARSNKLAVEALKGLLTHVVKRDVFNRDDVPM